MLYIYVHKFDDDDDDDDDDDELFPSDKKKKPTVPSVATLPNKDTTDVPPPHKVTS